MSFTLCPTHILPAKIETVIVTMVKIYREYIHVELSDSNYYRPIAPATIVSKMLDSVLLLKYVKMYLLLTISLNSTFFRYSSH